jgi:hypothetical protein
MMFSRVARENVMFKLLQITNATDIVFWVLFAFFLSDFGVMKGSFLVARTCSILPHVQER